MSLDPQSLRYSREHEWLALGEGADLSLVPGQPGQQLVVLVDGRGVRAAGPVRDRSVQRGEVEEDVLLFF